MTIQKNYYDSSPNIKFAVCVSVQDASSPKLLNGMAEILHGDKGVSWTLCHFGDDRT